MKNLLWLINSILAILELGLLLLLIWGRPAKIARKPLKVGAAQISAQTSPLVSIDIQRIYERDPFGTSSVTRATTAQAQLPFVEPLPAAPQLQMAMPVQIPAPTFLPPLAIVLKGVAYSHHERDNRAIIADKKTKQERLYQVGDSLLDAEIIRIESNKVMLLRSNGQQETIFVSPSEARNDALYQTAEGKRGTSVPIKKITENSFAVDPVLFVQYITNLAQFIDSLDITTAFDKGQSIGCKIGSLAQNSIGILCGFQNDDIVVSINDIPTATTAQRLGIYQQIVHMHEGDTIRVTLLRGADRKNIELSYAITSFNPKKPPVQPKQLPRQIPQQQTNIPAPQNSQFPIRPLQSSENIVEKLHKQNKHAMLEHGGRSATTRPIKP